MPASSEEDKPIRFSFDAENKLAQKIAREYSAEQVQLITVESKLAIRQVINRSIREGIPPREAARLLRDVVGLNRPQAIQVSDYSKNLDPKMSLALRRKAIERLSRKLIRRRAVMIARTEVIDALNTGAEVAWKQAQNQGILGRDARKEWIATAGACELCLELERKDPIPLNNSFGLDAKGNPLYRPTAHPNCRCAVVPVPESRET